MASWLDNALKGLVSGKDGELDLLGAAVSLGGGYLLDQSGIGQARIPQTGYQGEIPEYEVQREVVPGTYDPNRRPGSGGQRYFTQTQYKPKSETPATPMSAEGLAALNAANPARQERRPGGCLLYTSPSPRDGLLSRMPSSA